MTPEREAGGVATLRWGFLAKRVLKVILLLFAAALVTDIIYFGFSFLRDPNALDKPIELRIKSSSTDVPIDRRGRWESKVWQEPRPKRTITITASPFRIAFDFELITAKTHPLAEMVAIEYTDREDDAALYESAFGRGTVNGQRLRAEDFQPLLWTVSSKDKLMHIRLEGVVLDQESAFVEILKSGESRPVSDEFKLSFTEM